MLAFLFQFVDRLHLVLQLQMTPFEFCRDIRHQKTSLCAIVWRYLREPTFSRFSRTPTCDRRTDRQADRHTTTAKTRAS